MWRDAGMCTYTDTSECMPQTRTQTVYVYLYAFVCVCVCVTYKYTYTYKYADRRGLTHQTTTRHTQSTSLRPSKHASRVL